MTMFRNNIEYFLYFSSIKSIQIKCLRFPDISVLFDDAVLHHYYVVCTLHHLQCITDRLTRMPSYRNPMGQVHHAATKPQLSITNPLR